MLFGSKKLMGLDIGTSSIKLVEVEARGKNFTLSSFGFIPTPPGSIVAGEVLQPEQLATAIRTLVNQTRTKRRFVSTGMWGTSVITKKIAIPRIEENLLGDQLKWEAEQYIPFDINEISLEYQVLRKANINPEQMGVLLVAAKRDLVLSYAEIVESAGLECSIVDVSGFALANCFEANYGKLEGGTVIILNVGASMTNFVALENGEVTFSRDVPVGGSSYTNDIQKSMGVTIDEAESLKISAGTGQAVPQEVTSTLAQTNEAVADEIRRSYDFFLATTTDARVQKVYVTGGGLGLPGLFEQIQRTMGLPLEGLNPFLGINYDSRVFTEDYIMQISPYAAVGLGLAMRKVGDR